MPRADPGRALQQLVEYRVPVQAVEGPERRHEHLRHPGVDVSRESAPCPGISLLQTANVSRGDCTDDVRFEFASGDIDLPPRRLQRDVQARMAASAAVFVASRAPFAKRAI